MASNAAEVVSRGTQTDLEPEQRMVRRLLQYISMSDKHEESRRKSDRIGGNLYYDKHWNVQVSDRRAAITVNVAAAIIDQKISIATKQEPTPVIEATDVGDAESARLMRSAIIQWWDYYNILAKVERAETIACATRSCALKALWDPTLYNGAGDIAVDEVPGWRLIVDNRVHNGEDMQFAGDRAMMPRARAMLLYPKAAEKIRMQPGMAEQGPSANASGTGTPIRDPWAKLAFDFPTSSIVNGAPTLLSYTGNVPNAAASRELVMVCEVYHKDYTLIDVERKKKDRYGRTKQKVSIDEETGLPKFRMTGVQNLTADDGTPYTQPTWELVLEDEMETVQERLFPWWRRTTLLLPDAKIIDDCAWDYNLPYAFFHDGESLEGFWVRGSLLKLETLQGALNVSLSTMLDNLRFSAYRAYLAYSGSMIDRNSMNINPGEILRAGEKGTIEPLAVSEISAAWFQWVEFVITLMEKVIGATGIMQGEAAGRVDSAAGYDILAEIGGSRIVKFTQRMERSIADLIQVVGQMMQKHYDARHAIKVEDATGNITYQRITPGALLGSFNYKVLTGSSLAWSETAVRNRVLEEFQMGLRDIISTWKALKIEDWPSIMARKLEMPPQLQPPPPRTRQQIPAQQRQKKPQQQPGAA